MPLLYDIPPLEGALRQGELLRTVWEHRSLHPAVRPAEDQRIPLDYIEHPLVVVLTADCDIEQDYKARADAGDSQDEVPAMIRQIQICDAYEGEGPLANIAGDLRRRIRQNQDERYHHIRPAAIGDPSRGELPDLYFDFKKSVALPVAGLYSAIAGQQIERVALLPSPWIHDLMHRFFGFQSRIALPD